MCVYKKKKKKKRAKKEENINTKTTRE